MPYWFDANNLIGQSAEAAREEKRTRRAFLALLSGYAHSRGGRFVVFFDGDDTHRAVPPRGVQVRYSAPASTDDAIIGLLSGIKAPHEVIVVTNDHGLSSRCRDAGARTISWEQFTAQMRPTRRTGPRERGADRAIDVQDWARYFGLDPDDLV